MLHQPFVGLNSNTHTTCRVYAYNLMKHTYSKCTQHEYILWVVRNLLKLQCWHKQKQNRQLCLICLQHEGSPWKGKQVGQTTWRNMWPIGHLQCPKYNCSNCAAELQQSVAGKHKGDTLTRWHISKSTVDNLLGRHWGYRDTGISWE